MVAGKHHYCWSLSLEELPLSACGFDGGIMLAGNMFQHVGAMDKLPDQHIKQTRSGTTKLSNNINVVFFYFLLS